MLVGVLVEVAVSGIGVKVSVAGTRVGSGVSVEAGAAVVEAGAGASVLPAGAAEEAIHAVSMKIRMREVVIKFFILFYFFTVRVRPRLNMVGFFVREFTRIFANLSPIRADLRRHLHWHQVQVLADGFCI